MSWNVNVRVRQRLLDQADALVAIRPDLVALQEISLTTAAQWQVLLGQAGLTHIVSSLDLAADPTLLVGPRRTGVLTASRWPLSSAATLTDSPWPERVLTTVVEAPAGPIELHNAYIPLGEHAGAIKVRTLEALYATLARSCGHHRLLCGDLNAPRVEYPDGRVLTWAQNEPTGSIQKARGQRYDDAERNILLGLADHDLANAFRTLHGYEKPAESWASVYRGRRYPRRLDHVLTAKSLGITAVRYINEWQHPTADRGALSDHAAMITDFEPTSTGGRSDRPPTANHCPGTPVGLTPHSI